MIVKPVQEFPEAVSILPVWHPRRSLQVMRCHLGVLSVLLKPFLIASLMDCFELWVAQLHNCLHRYRQPGRCTRTSNGLKAQRRNYYEEEEYGRPGARNVSTALHRTAANATVVGQCELSCIAASCVGLGYCNITYTVLQYDIIAGGTACSESCSMVLERRDKKMKKKKT